MNNKRAIARLWITDETHDIIKTQAKKENLEMKDMIEKMVKNYLNKTSLFPANWNDKTDWGNPKNHMAENLPKIEPDKIKLHLDTHRISVSL